MKLSENLSRTGFAWKEEEINALAACPSNLLLSYALFRSAKEISIMRTYMRNKEPNFPSGLKYGLKQAYSLYNKDLRNILANANFLNLFNNNEKDTKSFEPEEDERLKRPWTNEEKEFLRDNYKKLSVREISAKLNRTEAAIRTVASIIFKNDKISITKEIKPKTVLNETNLNFENNNFKINLFGVKLELESQPKEIKMTKSGIEIN